MVQGNLLNVLKGHFDINLSFDIKNDHFPIFQHTMANKDWTLKKSESHKNFDAIMLILQQYYLNIHEVVLLTNFHKNRAKMCIFY